METDTLAAIAVLAWVAAVVAGVSLVSRGLHSGERSAKLFRPLEERDVTFRPLTVVPSPAELSPPRPSPGPPCWVCGQPKDEHRHED